MLKLFTKVNNNFSITKEVINPGYCIGCGLCKILAPEKISIGFNRLGFYEPIIEQPISVNESDSISKICPFSKNVTDETTIGRELYSEGTNYDEKLGFVSSTHAIRVQEGTIREKATSGGFTTWILCELLRRGLVDAVIHVGNSQEANPDFPHFGYLISTTVEEIRSRSKTRYYPVEVGSVIAGLKDDTRRFAVTGLPCFIKGIQNLRRFSGEWRDRIPFTISLFCGHLKSRFFTENLLHAAGVPRDEASTIDYRRKLPGKTANNYIFGVFTREVWKDRNMAKIAASDWGSGSFKYYACNFCDDVIGETADVSVGDVWLPRYRVDGGGTSNVVTRNPLIDDLIDQGRAEGRLWVEPLTVEEVHSSTKGGFEDRRAGTSVRWHLEKEAGGSPPPKRFITEKRVRGERSEVHAFKVLIGIYSTPLFRFLNRFGALALFRFLMLPVIVMYRRRFPKFLFKHSVFTRLVVANRKSNL